MKLIINADDCGKSVATDQAIGRLMEAGKLTSTTVMANMDDLEGAVKLYREFHGSASFGIHLNLTQGRPLTYSQELLDKGYCREMVGAISLDANHLRNKWPSAGVQRALEKELCAQIEKVLDSGIHISHIDSHHHVHTSLMLMRLTPILSKRYGISKMRRMRNFVPGASSVNIAMRNFWMTLMRLQNHAVEPTDFFCGYQEWHDVGMPVFSADTTMELMCHPGAGSQEEDAQILATNFSTQDIELINYNDL